MATVNLNSLRKKAREAGMENARGASREELEAFLAKPKKGAVKKKSASSGPVKKQAGRKQTRGSSKSSPAKSKTGAKAKRTTTPTKAKSNGEVGRAAIEGVKFTGYDEDAWNPREGSATFVVFKALKKFKGNREKVFDALKSQITELVPAKNRAGKKRTKSEREERLHYYINRTLYEFAIKTGQHTKGSNRIDYGTGDNASVRVRGKTILKAAKSSAKKTTAKKATARKKK